VVLILVLVIVPEKSRKDEEEAEDELNIGRFMVLSARQERARHLGRSLLSAAVMPPAAGISL
jgi:hypothetical protein